MLHPSWTEALAGQRRAALNAEAGRERLVRQTRPPPRAAAERGRLVTTARTLAYHVRGLVARAT
jgi:hypothetical protein